MFLNSDGDVNYYTEEILPVEEPLKRFSSLKVQ